MGSFKGAILQGAHILRQGKTTKPFAEFMNRTCSALQTRWGLWPTSVALLGWLWTSWRDFDWGSVIFTDETSISSNCESRGHVYREPVTRYDTCYDQRHERSGRFSVSCWGWMSWAGIGMLECIHGLLNALQYVHILKNMMLPSVRVWNPKGNLIFQQDNHPMHCSMGI